MTPSRQVVLKKRDSANGSSIRNLQNNNSTYNTFDDDSPIWDDINKLNPEYRNQLAPYLQYEYHLGLLDRFGNFIGFNTSEDKYRMQMQAQARAQLSALTQNQFQNDYNSAQSQASRERDAGLNPDLTGTSDSDPAASVDQPITPIDPSIFEVPSEILVDVASLFGTVSSALQSVQTFRKLATDRNLTKANIINTEVDSVDKAWTTAGNWLSSFDPATRLSFDDIKWEDYKTDEERRAALDEAVVRAFNSDIQSISPKSQALLKKAMTARYKDPAIRDKYYNNYNAAQKSRLEKVALDSAIGSLDLADDVVSAQNNIILDFYGAAFKNQFELNATISAYNVMKARNDFDYELFKQVHHIPSEVAETELAGYLAAQAKYSADEARAKATESWLNELLGLKEKNDPAGIYLLNALLQGGYAPLLQQSGKIGLPMGAGFSGSWSSYPVPGMPSGSPIGNPDSLDTVHPGQPHM